MSGYSLSREQARAVFTMLRLSSHRQSFYLTEAGVEAFEGALAVLARSTFDESVARGRRCTMGLRVESRDGGHVHCTLFVGRTIGARGCAGRVVLRVDEFDELVAAGLVDVVP